MVVDLYVLALGALAARQIFAIRRLDWSRPVTAIQTRLESLRLERARTALAAVLVGTLLWIPAVAVVVAAVAGVDLYARVSPAWLAANFAFAGRSDRGGSMVGPAPSGKGSDDERVAGGRARAAPSLRSALTVLAELREFEGTSGAPGTDASADAEGWGEP